MIIVGADVFGFDRTVDSEEDFLFWPFSRGSFCSGAPAPPHSVDVVDENRHGTQ
jgi:hypothetical protein